MLNIGMRPTKEVMILDLKGKLRAGGADELLTDKVNSLLHQGFRKILINLEFVTSVDSAGFGALTGVQHAVTDAGGQIGLLNVTTRLQSLIIITGLLTHFRLFDSEPEALVALAPSRPVPRATCDEPEDRFQVFGAM